MDLRIFWVFFIVFYALSCGVVAQVEEEDGVLEKDVPKIILDDDEPEKIFKKGDKLPRAMQIVPLVDVICADLMATPQVLPNGEKQYPQMKCPENKYFEQAPLDAPLAAPAPARPTPRPAASEVVPTATGTPVAGDDEASRMDLNMRQMMRLGELDAMQGRPVNMTYANELGYMQGYTLARERLMNRGGGFGGIRR